MPLSHAIGCPKAFGSVPCCSTVAQAEGDPSRNRNAQRGLAIWHIIARDDDIVHGHYLVRVMNTGNVPRHDTVVLR